MLGVQCDPFHEKNNPEAPWETKSKTLAIRTQLETRLMCDQPPTFDPPGDVQEVALVVLPQISRVQPAVLVDGLRGFLRHVQVAHEDVAAPETNLSAAVGVGLVQLGLTTRHHLAAAGERRR